MWSGERSKRGLESDALARTYGAVEFGEHLRYDGACHTDREAVMQFLLAHYDGHARAMIEWLLDRATIQTALRSAKTGAVVAFMAGVPLPVRTAGYTGTALLGTLLCVLPALRSTGLVRKFLAANMKLSAEQGYAVRCSTATTPIALPPVCTPARHVCWPGEWRVAERLLKAAAIGPVSTARVAALRTLAEHAPVSGVDWARVDWPEHPALTYWSGAGPKGRVAAVLLDVNDASAQVLGAAATDPALLRPLLVWVASRRRRAIVVEATHPSTLHSSMGWAKPDEVNPRYHVYFHNAEVTPQECAIPML